MNAAANTELFLKSPEFASLDVCLLEVAHPFYAKQAEKGYTHVHCLVFGTPAEIQTEYRDFLIRTQKIACLYALDARFTDVVESPSGIPMVFVKFVRL